MVAKCFCVSIYFLRRRMPGVVQQTLLFTSQNAKDGPRRTVKNLDLSRARDPYIINVTPKEKTCSDVD